MKKKKALLLTGIIFLLVVVAGLCVWKRRGIRNTFYKITTGTVPFQIKEKEQMTAHGYYRQAVKAKTELDKVTLIAERDEAAEAFETNVPVEKTLVADSYEIDRQIEAELDNGYTWEEPIVIINPYKISPLTGLILFETPEDERVRITVKGKTKAADIVSELEPVSRHRVPVVGLYPGTENTVVLELVDEQGNVKESQELKVWAEELPENLRDSVEVVESSGESAFGLTAVYGQKCKMPFAYDLNGDIRWYFEREAANYGIYQMSDGRIIFQDITGYVPCQQKPQSTNLYEMDCLGRAYRVYYIPGGNHHEVIEKEPGGNLLVLTSSLKSCYEEKIVEIDRQTGEIVNELELGDIFGQTYVDKPDWAHINTVSYQPEGDTILISARNLNSVMKINWSTHKLEWILCDPRFWKGTKFEKYVLQPEGDFVYHFEQHTAYQLEANLDKDPRTVEVCLFDNHYNKDRNTDYYDGNEASYVVVYSINEEEAAVKQIKRLPVTHSYITSAAIYDSESNHIFGMCGKAINDAGEKSGMNYEFDYETGEVLNQYYISRDFYRSTELTLNFQDMSQKMKEEENYILGSLRPVVKISRKVKTPEETLEDAEVGFKLIGSVLYVGAMDHHISQVIFKGKNHTYVYDSTDIRLHNKVYLGYYADTPIPLSQMKADDYEIYCVYKDVYYQTGHRITVKE